jgi:hypothetical protein
MFVPHLTLRIFRHAFFVEDGVEVFNRIENNLACVSKPSMSLLNTDQTPASFWITNAHNYVSGNAAAGSANYGYWYRPEGPTGTSQNTPGICPEQTPLLVFENNVAHSNGRYGLRIFDKYFPKVRVIVFLFGPVTAVSPPCSCWVAG